MHYRVSVQGDDNQQTVFSRYKDAYDHACALSRQTKRAVEISREPTPYECKKMVISIP